MKILLLIMSLITLSFPVTLKGIALGKKLNVNNNKLKIDDYGYITYSFTTTVASVKGLIDVYLLNDNTITEIEYNTKSCKSVSAFMKAVENRYNIKFKPVITIEGDTLKNLDILPVNYCTASSSVIKDSVEYFIGLDEINNDRLTFTIIDSRTEKQLYKEANDRYNRAKQDEHNKMMNDF